MNRFLQSMLDTTNSLYLLRIAEVVLLGLIAFGVLMVALALASIGNILETLVGRDLRSRRGALGDRALPQTESR